MIAHIIVPSVDWWTGLDNLSFWLLPPANFTFIAILISHCNTISHHQFFPSLDLVTTCLLFSGPQAGRINGRALRTIS